MAKTGIAALPKTDRTMVRSHLSKSTRALRERFRSQQMLDAGVGYLANTGAAFVDHKFRKGIEAEARFGGEDSKIRPQVNAVIGLVATLAGVLGGKQLGQYAGTALAIGQGFGGPAVYNFTRKQLAK